MRCLYYKVYALADVPHTWERYVAIGCLKARPAAAAFGATAAAIHGLFPERLPVHIGSRRALADVDDLRFHRVALPNDHVQVVRGLKVTSVERTLLDACAEFYPKGSQRILHRALREELTDVATLERFTEEEARSGRSGIRVIRAHLSELDPTIVKTKSDFEDDVYRCLVGAGYTAPIRNHLIDSGRGFPWEIDLFWPRIRLALEADHSYTHLDLDVFHRDREKDLELEALGCTVIRVTEEMFARRSSFLELFKRIYAGAEERAR